MTSVKVENVWKVFGKVAALKGVSLEVREGELVTLLGPSGCGKTTLLRIISGLYKPTSGKVYFDGEDVTDKAPWERNVGLVFQDYALWPHMKVFDNIAYGLKLRRLPRDEIRRRVAGVARMLGIEELLDRYPHQLSGGQQQRVALARALVVEPRVLLLDEPLSNLDAKIRVNVRAEIKRLQKALKITTIYVTHDQEEALVISDRIAVMNFGTIEQVGTPLEVYYSPKTLFVADFVGQVNVLEGNVKAFDRERQLLSVETGVGTILARSAGDAGEGDSVYVLFRPESVEVCAKPCGGSGDSTVLEGAVDFVQFLGNTARIDVSVGGAKLRAEVHNPLRSGLVSPGERVYLRIPADSVRVLKAAGGGR
ncbi:MAG: ABC transporter ATP-binding protein [Thermofilum sp.]|jgi:ABC-type Fe3+/spermidine/putrescine transport system ATPase subunit|nr:ABC transporter ATP-binding protein [Thermofilum sp.]MCC6065214.1 ABC transporter ATP-binding protein [Thermofilum sp.]